MTGPYDLVRVRAALAGLVFPVRTWQLCAQADAYGADSHTREALSRLPVTTYSCLEAVLTDLRAASPAQPVETAQHRWWEPGLAEDETWAGGSPGQ